MKKSINTLLLACICALSISAEGAAITLNLRSTSQPSAPRLLSASAPKSSCLQSAAFPAGATATSELSVGDVLTFLLFKDTEIRITLSERMESPLGGEAFLGTVSGYDGVKNAVVLQTADGLTVDIQDFARSRTYTIVSDANGVTVKEIDPSLETVTPTEPVDPGISARQSSPSLLAAPLAARSADQPTTIVDVLVAYDAPAAAWARQNGSGITNFATLAVQKMNTVLGNCGFGSTFRYRLVGVMTVDAIGSADLSTDLLANIRDGVGNWAPIRAMRDTVGADIVTTLIDTGSANGTTGRGYSLKDMAPENFSESAYNICAIRSVAQSHTMTHEVGHNLGAGHATAVNPSEISPGPQLYSYSAGHYFTGDDGIAYHTIMAYNYDGYGNHYQGAPFFSSPDYTYMNTPVGDATHDNVRTIQQTYLAASKWRDQVLPMSYDVYFSPENGTLFTDSVTVTLTPGKSGTEIRYTTDGSSPTTSSTLYTGPITLTETTTIRAVTVTDGIAGPIFQATYSVSDIGTGIDAPQLTWTTSPSYPWEFQTDTTYDGVDAVRSAYFSSGNEQGPTWLKTTVTGPTTMSFRYMKYFYASSFTVKCDSRTLYTDTMSGASSDWSLVEIDIPSGSHEIEFSFLQRGYYYDSVSGNYTFNGIWLDTVRFDALSRHPTISPVTTAHESSATIFTNSLTVTFTPPSGKSGFLFYTLDGSDPTGETQILYQGPIALTKSTRIRAIFVEGGKEPSVEVGGLFLERHPVSPGEWTTDVDGAKTAAAQNGRLIAVMLANREGCWYSQRFYPIAESPEFLAWAAANGIYLVTGDQSCNIDAETAYNWFWQLRSNYGESGSVGMPTIFFAYPNAPTQAIAKGFARNGQAIGSVTYLDTVESLIAGVASVLDNSTSVPQAPICSLTRDLIDAFPVSVSLSNPNGTGTIYYTLDGSVPTPTNGIAYLSGDIIITNATTKLSAIVWPDSGLSGCAYIGHFMAVENVFGTSGVAWSFYGDTDCQWRLGDTDDTLRAGGLRNGKIYDSCLRATVKGKGRLVFTYCVGSYYYGNMFSFYRGENEVLSHEGFYDHEINDWREWFSGTVTNVVETAGTTSFTWRFHVDYPQYDYQDMGVWLSDVKWIPDRTLLLIR